MSAGLKVLVRHRIRFDGVWTHYATVLTGLSFFLLVVNFFGIRNLLDCNFGDIIFSLAVPMVVWIVFMILLRGLRFPDARMYGILGALYCLCMIVRSLTYENIFMTVFAVIWYVLAAVVCLGTTGGFIANRTYMSVAFLLPAIYRLIFIDLSKYILNLDLLGFIPEATGLSGLVVFGVFALSLEARALKRSGKRQA